MMKWCTWFCNQGHEIHVISFTSGIMETAEIHQIDLGVDTNGSDLSKLKYLFAGKKIKKLVDEIKPDVINVHYATSYGTAVALSGIKQQYVLSVWGSDIYDFPRKSVLHKALLKYSLYKATMLFSTSQAMAEEAKNYTNKQFIITPFGVDMNLFNPSKRTRTQNDNGFIIGTVKSLADLYGIDCLLEAAAKLKKEYPEIPISIRISGDGPKSDELKKLATDLNLGNETLFLGKISQEQAAVEWANMDVAVIPSILYESFGVSAVEAEACETPVIISDVGGLMEATLPGASSIVTPRKDTEAISEAIYKLFNDDNLRRKMGIQGREYVINKYELNNCFKLIESKLIEIANSKESG